MAVRKHFAVSLGQQDTTAPQELYRLISLYKYKHGLPTVYAALAEMLKLAAKLDQ